MPDEYAGGVLRSGGAGQVVTNVWRRTEIGYRQDSVIINGASASLIELPTGQQGLAAAVGPGGQVAGTMWAFDPSRYTGGTGHAYLAQNGKVTDLGTLGGVWSWPRAVNGTGQIVGVSDTGTMVVPPGYVNYQVPAAHAFLANNGQMKDLGVLDGDQHSIALAVNSKGQVVGMSGVRNSGIDTSFFGSSNALERSTTGGRAFVFDGTKMHDLNSLVDPKGRVNIDSAVAINDLGQVLATGWYDTTVRSALLLTPVDQPIPVQPPVLIPEPGTLAIFGLFLAAAARSVVGQASACRLSSTV